MRDYWKASPFIAAAEGGHEECIRLLLQSGANPNDANNADITALMHAVCKGSDACVKLLLDAGADVNVLDTCGRTALTSAVNGGSNKCVKLIIDNFKGDMNRKDNFNMTLMMYAAETGNCECIEILKEAGADVNEGDGNQPLL